MLNGAIPLDKAGTISLQQLPEKTLVKQYLEKQKVSDEVLLDYLEKMFQKLLGKLAEKKHEDLSNIVEKRFYEKLLSK